MQETENLLEDPSFEAKFPIGEPIQVEWKGDKYFSALRGVFFARYVIIDLPKSKERQFRYDPNDYLVFRFLSSGKVFNLKSVILQAHTDPSLLILDYPETIAKHDLRKGKRLQLLIPAQITEEGGSTKMSGALLDLSKEGALIGVGSSASFAKGDKVNLSMILPTGASEIRVRCDIRSVKPYNSEKTLLGIVFDKPDRDTINVLHNFYDTCFSYHGIPLTDRKDIGTLSAGHEIMIEVDGNRAKTVVRGWSFHEQGYFLLDSPTHLSQYRVGTKGIMRFEKGGTVCGVKVHFASFIQKANLWVLKIYERMVQDSMRSNERYSCIIPASLKNHESGEEIGKVIITDLSLGGARLVTKKSLSLSEGDFLDIDFVIPGHGDTNQTMEVKRHNEYEGIFTYSGPFISMNVEDENKFREFFDLCKEWALELNG